MITNPARLLKAAPNYYVGIDVAEGNSVSIYERWWQDKDGNCWKSVKFNNGSWETWLVARVPRFIFRWQSND